MPPISQRVLRAEEHLLGIELRRPFELIGQEYFLWKIRSEREGIHRSQIYVAAVMLTYSPSILTIENLPRMDVDDFHDTCNKSVSLYIPRYRRWSLLFTVLHNYIYRQWFRPYQSEIEHQRFLCKFIAPRDLGNKGRPSQTSIQSIISLHEAICAEVDARSRHYEDLRRRFNEPYAILTELPARPALYVLQPLFKALLMIFCSKEYRGEDSTQVAKLPVYLVRTGVEKGLSAPISFLPIAAKIDVYLGAGQGTVRTSLETAIGFIMDLERRERDAFGLRPDPWRPDTWTMNWFQTPIGAGRLVGPSSWLVNSEERSGWDGDGFDVDRMLKALEEQELENNDGHCSGAARG
ncbi:hypothetical protein ACSS6W_006924 [Trichoderma asperelloides]|nr:hypothetical protein LI328DRAFT_168705 [Trichoderma asperelloides]